MRTHNGSIRKEENARFVADLFIVAQTTDDPMLNPIEGCWNVLKSTHNKNYVPEKKEELLVRGEYDMFTAHRLTVMKEAVELAKSAITRRLVSRMERHYMRVCFAAEREEDMELGK
eukprot:jgi/Phyca11/126497/e_gw1.63.103.1